MISEVNNPIFHNKISVTDYSSSQETKYGRWREEEHLKFIEAIFLNGNDWKKVSDHIKTRTTSQTRSHAQKFFLKIINYFKKNEPEVKLYFSSKMRIVDKIINYLCEFLFEYSEKASNLVNSDTNRLRLANLLQNYSKLKRKNTKFNNQTINFTFKKKINNKDKINTKRLIKYGKLFRIEKVKRKDYNIKKINFELNELANILKFDHYNLPHDVLKNYLFLNSKTLNNFPPINLSNFFSNYLLNENSLNLNNFNFSCVPINLSSYKSKEELIRDISVFERLKTIYLNTLKSKGENRKENSIKKVGKMSYDGAGIHIDDLNLNNPFSINFDYEDKNKLINSNGYEYIYYEYEDKYYN